MGARERWSSDDGFTLLELVVVIIILGILATIAIAVFLGQREKAFRSVAKSALRNTVTYAEIVREDGPEYSDEIGAYEAEAPESYSFTNGASEGAQDLSLAAFDGGEVLAIAANARGTCLYVVLTTRGSGDLRGHHTGDDCEASDLGETPTDNGWP